MPQTSLSPGQKALLVAGFLTSGSVNTLTKKWQFQTCAPTGDSAHNDHNPCPAGEKQFHKPWTQNMEMFFGEACVIVLFLARRSARAREIMEVGGGPAAKAPFHIFALPACFDILGTGVGGVGMLYISASVWQMMRGSLIIFTSVLSVVFLKKQLHPYNYIAVLTCAFGLFLVGVSAIFDEGGASSNVPLGILLTVVSQMFAASQMVVEELYVKGHNAPPEQVVGSEGVWGIALMCLILAVMYVIPGSDDGSYENVVDSLHMLSSGGRLLAFVLVYLCSIAFFNFFGVTISGQLSAVHRTINDAMRTMIIWTVEIMVYYTVSKPYGTPWQHHTYLQLVGFAFIICGNLMNNAILRIPGLYYPTTVVVSSATAPADDSRSGVGICLVDPAHGQDS